MNLLRNERFYELDDFDGEIWADIPDFQNTFAVSNLGRVKRYEKTWYSGRKGCRIKRLPESIVKQRTLKDGYVKTTISYNGIKKSYSVHVLVAKAFIPNPDNKRVVNHIDRNKENNCIDNLEWATDKENVHHMLITGSKNLSLTRDDVFEIRALKHLHPNLNSKQISEIGKWNRNATHRVISGVGYKFF